MNYRITYKRPNGNVEIAYISHTEQLSVDTPNIHDKAQIPANSEIISVRRP